MSASNKSSLLFFGGLVLGIFFASVFFIMNLSAYFKPSANHTDDHKNLFPTTPSESNKNVNVLIEKTEIEKMQPAPTIHTQNGVPLTSVLQEADSLLLHSSLPSLPAYTSENIIVKTEKLLHASSIAITTIGNQHTISQADSILSQLSDIKTPSKNTSSIRLEFWQSPVNFKGYKLSSSKLVLFGLNPDLEVKLVRYQNKIWMQYEKEVYELQYTALHKSFDKTTDASITELLLK